MSWIETELRLRLRGVGVELLRRHPSVGELTLGTPAFSFVEATYFDTPESFLRRNDMILTIEQVKDENETQDAYRQIFTHRGTCLDGFWSRREWSAKITANAPSLNPLLHIKPGLDFADAEFLGRLQPAFHLAFQRTAWRLKINTSLVDLAFDRGHLRTRSAEAPFAEAFIQHVRGDVAELYSLAERLHDLQPFHLSASGPAIRGRAMVNGKPLQPRKAKPPALAPDMTIGETMRAIARSCSHHFMLNHDSLLTSGDPEALHQMRVALRRFRSAVALLKSRLDTPETQTLREEIRWIETDLGPARDAQVFLSEIFEPLDDEFGSDTGFRALKTHFRDHWRELQDRVVRLLLQPRFTQALLMYHRWIECGDWRAGPMAALWLDMPARDVAAAILERHSKQVAKAMQGLAELDDATRHGARIRIKKLRYASDFFASLFPDSTVETTLAALGRIQDRLGRLNDIAVARTLITDQARDSGGAEQRRAASRIVDRLSEETAPLLESAVKEWHAYRHLKPFWGPAGTD